MGVFFIVFLFTIMVCVLVSLFIAWLTIIGEQDTGQIEFGLKLGLIIGTTAGLILGVIAQSDVDRKAKVKASTSTVQKPWISNYTDVVFDSLLDKFDDKTSNWYYELSDTGCDSTWFTKLYLHKDGQALLVTQSDMVKKYKDKDSIWLSFKNDHNMTTNIISKHLSTGKYALDTNIMYYCFKDNNLILNLMDTSNVLKCSMQLDSSNDVYRVFVFNVMAYDSIKKANMIDTSKSTFTRTSVKTEGLIK